MADNPCGVIHQEVGKSISRHKKNKRAIRTLGIIPAPVSCFEEVDQVAHNHFVFMEPWRMERIKGDAV